MVHLQQHLRRRYRYRYQHQFLHLRHQCLHRLLHSHWHPPPLLRHRHPHRRRRRQPHRRRHPRPHLHWRCRLGGSCAAAWRPGPEGAGGSVVTEAVATTGLPLLGGKPWQCDCVASATRCGQRVARCDYLNGILLFLTQPPTAAVLLPVQRAQWLHSAAHREVAPRSRRSTQSGDSDCAVGGRRLTDMPYSDNKNIMPPI